MPGQNKSKALARSRGGDCILAAYELVLMMCDCNGSKDVAKMMRTVMMMVLMLMMKMIRIKYKGDHGENDEGQEENKE